MATGLAVGIDAGHVTTKKAKKASPSSRKGVRGFQSRLSRARALFLFPPRTLSLFSQSVCNVEILEEKNETRWERERDLLLVVYLFSRRRSFVFHDSKDCTIRNLFLPR